MSGNSVGSSSRIRHPPAIATTTVAMPISTPARRAVDGVGCIASAIVADGGGVPAHPLGMSPRHPGRDDRRGMTCSQTSSTALIEDIVRLAAIPSISAPGYPQPTHAALGDAYELVAALLRDAGLQNVAPLELPGTAPAVTGEIPAPPGAPTVLLYSHYDVVPAGDEALWTSPPWVPTERDGALYGRGTADSKANIISHVGALRAWDGRPPVGIRVIIEGQEEVGGGDLLAYPGAHPEAVACDAM